MASNGDELFNPATGLRTVFRQTAEETNGELLQVDWIAVVVAQAGAPHAAWNAGSEEVHALVDFRPALRTETAFETLAGLAQDGMTTSAGAPKNPLRLALVLRHFEDEIYLARPPLAVQRVLLGAVAAVGRLLGYRPEYPCPDHLQPTNQPVGSNQ